MNKTITHYKKTNTRLKNDYPGKRTISKDKAPPHGLFGGRITVGCVNSLTVFLQKSLKRHGKPRKRVKIKDAIIDTLCVNDCVLIWSEWRDLNPRHPAPKAGALPTALHPVIQFLLLYHAAGENQSFSCLWSFIWSKRFYCPACRPGQIPQMPVLQGLPGFSCSYRG